MAISDGVVYVGGTFVRKLVGLDDNTGILKWNSFIPRNPGWVNTISVSGDTVYIGGSFTEIGGITRNNVAAVTGPALFPATLYDWDPNIDGPVSSLSVHNNTIYIGGQFKVVSGNERTNSAAVTTEGILTDWTPGTISREPAQYPVETIVSDSNTIFVGGNFNMINAVKWESGGRTKLNN